MCVGIDKMLKFTLGSAVGDASPASAATFSFPLRSYLDAMFD